jgi:hypothetical protein
MIVRKLRLYGYRKNTEPCEISVMFDKNQIFHGEISQTSSALICEHKVLVDHVKIAEVENAHSHQAIPKLVTTHSYVIQCIMGEACITDVQADALHDIDIPLVQDPEWFSQSFDEIHVFGNYNHAAPSTRLAGQDVKYNIAWSTDGMNFNRKHTANADDEQGVYHADIQCNERLHFDIMVRNLIEFYN